MRKSVEQSPALTVISMVFLHLLLLGCSIICLALLQEAVRLVADVNLWILITVWLTLLLFFVLRRPNIFAMQVAGAQTLTRDEEKYLQPLWWQATERAQVPPERYVLRVVKDQRLSVDRDAGWHVVTISTGAIIRLTPEEMSGVLGQKLGRHVGLQASIFSLTIWMALPTLLMLGLAWGAWKAMKALRKTAKEANLAGDRVNPKTEFQAGIGLFYYLLALAAWVLVIALALFLIFPTLAALAAILVLIGLARWSEYNADQFAVRLGYGPSLAASLRKFQGVEESVKSWRQMLSLYPRLSARIELIENAVA